MSRAPGGKTDKKKWILLGSIGLLIGLSAFLLTLLLKQEKSFDSLSLLPEPRVISEFELISADGDRFSRENLLDRWTLVFFGFTNCPDVCPNTLYELQNAADRVAESLDHSSDSLQVVFISVDPARDTVEKIAEYVEFFGDELIGLTGSNHQLRSLATELGIAFELEEPSEETKYYDVLHSSAVVLINPDGQLHGAFMSPHHAESISGDMLKLLD